MKSSMRIIIFIQIYADIFEVEYAHDPNASESTVQEWPTLLQTLTDVKQKIEEVRRKSDRITEDQRDLHKK